MEWYNYWKEARLKMASWHLGLGCKIITASTTTIKLAHYANAAADIEFRVSHWDLKSWKEYIPAPISTLSQHESISVARSCNTSIPELNQNYVPYVVETSVGSRPHVSGRYCRQAYNEEKLRRRLGACGAEFACRHWPR
jgi:glycyl-tRNA synthetase